MVEYELSISVSQFWDWWASFVYYEWQFNISINICDNCNALWMKAVRSRNHILIWTKCSISSHLFRLLCVVTILMDSRHIPMCPDITTSLLIGKYEISSLELFWQKILKRGVCISSTLDYADIMSYVRYEIFTHISYLSKSVLSVLQDYGRYIGLFAVSLKRKGKSKPLNRIWADSNPRNSIDNWYSINVSFLGISILGSLLRSVLRFCKPRSSV